MKAHGALLIAVDAERASRYDRVVRRGSATDKVDFDTWVDQEEREWHNNEAHDMNVPAVMAQADYTVINGGSFEELHAHIEKILSEIKK